MYVQDILAAPEVCAPGMSFTANDIVDHGRQVRSTRRLCCIYLLSTASYIFSVNYRDTPAVSVGSSDSTCGTEDQIDVDLKGK